MSDADAPRRLGFPWVALALCAACVGAAAWTWMRYSHCWDVRAKDFRVLWFIAGEPRPLPSVHPNNALLGKYVQLPGRLSGFTGSPPIVEVIDPKGESAWIYLPSEELQMKYELTDGVFVGRVVSMEGHGERTPEPWPVIDTTASRFHPASIAGLVVGAWGVFIFVAAFLHWRRRRRLHGEQAAEET